MIKIYAGKKEQDELWQRLEQRAEMDAGSYGQQVEKIVQAVKRSGDQALLELTQRFDHVELTPEQLRVSEEEIREAYDQIEPSLLEALRLAHTRLVDFHQRQLNQSWFTTSPQGSLLGQMIRPLASVGLYIPGGTASYPSSVLMNAVPARVAGVKRIAMVTPPGRDGRISPLVLVAAHEAGITEIYRVGGAQAIAALAFGTASITKVDKIVGPGNIYVAMAKRQVYGYVDIDMVAGPSEILVLADESANPAWVAADLLSQAEHDPLAAAVLITPSRTLAMAVSQELERQLAVLPRQGIAEQSLRDFGGILLVDSLDDGMTAVNRFAPEHLELAVVEPTALLGKVENAGAIFMGHHSPEALGDYLAGPNHVLPTARTARFSSPLSVHHFQKTSSVIHCSAAEMRELAPAVIRLAQAEGLEAHARSALCRLGGQTGTGKES